MEREPVSSPPNPGDGPTGPGRPIRDVRRTARQVADEADRVAREKLNAAAARQQLRARDELRALAHALDRAAASFDEERHPRFGDWSRRAARRLERASGYFDGRDLDALLRDGRRLARARPALFYGGLFAGGLVVGRYLATSAAETVPGHAGGPV